MKHRARAVQRRSSGRIFPSPLTAAAAASLLALAVLSCGGARGDGPRSIDISGTWKIMTGDDVKYAGAGYDDSRDDEIRIPGDWLDRISGREDMAAVVWLRKNVVIGGEFRGARLMLSLGDIGVSDEVYFNGALVGGTGTIPAEGGSRRYSGAWKTPRYYALPAPLVKFGGSNIVAIRAYSQVFSGMAGKQLIVGLRRGWPDRRLADYIPLLVNIFALSLCAVFFFIFMSLFLANRRRPVYLLFALIVFSGALFNLNVMPLMPHMSGLARMKPLMIAYASISFFISLAMQEIFNVRFRRSSAVLLISLGILAGCIIAAPTTRFLVRCCGLAAVLSVLSCQAYSSFIFIRAVALDLRRYWLLLFMAPVVFSAFRNAYYLLTMQFNAVYASIFLHVPVLIVVATLFFFYDYEYQKRSGEGIYQTLLKKSRRLQRDLSKAKKTGAKPEPGELIDGLIEYLDTHSSETYNRRELSKKFGLNENYMVQLFKKRTGETISNYINARRIEQAKLLLSDDAHKIIDIAFHVGFENYTHFHRQFRKATGMTPRDYRDRSGG